MKRLQIPIKLVYEIAVVKKINVLEIAAVKLPKKLLPEKRKKKNMQTKKPQFKSRLNKLKLSLVAFLAF